MSHWPCLLSHPCRTLADLGLRHPTNMHLRFLAHVPGGLTQGEIGVAEITRADWSVIGGRWAEQASQGALMHADKPCIEHVQACQTLALFWFARSETIRTNMHTGSLPVVTIAMLSYHADTYCRCSPQALLIELADCCNSVESTNTSWKTAASIGTSNSVAFGPLGSPSVRATKTLVSRRIAGPT